LKSGSNALDLFKLYVDDLKARYHEDKKIIKEIVREKPLDITVTTSFDEYNDLLKEDKRFGQLDPVNIKIVFAGYVDRAEIKEKERLKDEGRKQRRLEQNFKSLLKKLEVDESTKYEEVKEKIRNEDAFLRLVDLVG
jgi:pre-mRNA-processing factor 40